MKKIISFLLLTAIMQQAISQTETFDIITYTPPKDWVKTTKEGVVSYTTINTTVGTFCSIAIYASAPSAGDVQKDFKKEWNDLVVKPFKADPNPKTEAQEEDGWQSATGISLIKMDSLDAFAILTVISGFGKTVSILARANDQSYAADVDELLAKMTFDKTATTTLKNNTVSTQTSGGNGTFGSVIYTSPPGWNIEKFPDGDILTPADLPKSQFMEIWVLPSMLFSGTMEQALQKSFDETVVKLNGTKMRDVDGGNYSMIPAKRSFRGWDYIRCSGGIHIGEGEYPPEFGLDIFLIKLNDRFEQVAVLNKRYSCDYSSYYPSDKLNYHNDIEKFLFSLQFSDWKEAIPSPGNCKGDGITGVWEGISMSVGLSKPGAELGAELRDKKAIFFSNGQACFVSNFPAQGLDGLNSWVRAEQNRRDWGTYTYSNGRGVLKMPYGDIPLRMENSKLVLTTNSTDHGFINIRSVDGARFNGTYAFSSKNFLGEETGKTPLISFTADGNFTDNGGISIMNHSTVSCLNEAKEPGSGTYEVKNYSVIFNYSDGRKIRIAFLGSGYDKNDQSPAVLAFSTNEDPFYKK